MCPHCKHSLSAKDLIPVLSWLSLGGKCRYCRKPISWQYPLVELLTAGLFLLSYVYWPYGFYAQGVTLFVFWLVFLVGFIALIVYDIRWFLLPNRIIYPLMWLALIQVIVLSIIFHGHLESLTTAAWGIVIGGGLFYALFQISKGKWIGGGDVKLGALLGLIVGGPGMSLLLLFTASLLGTVVALPLLATGRVKRDSHLPFGPFLIVAAIIVYLFGTSILNWYRRQFLFY